MFPDGKNLNSSVLGLKLRGFGQENCFCTVVLNDVGNHSQESQFYTFCLVR